MKHFLLALLILPLICSAEIYQRINPDGSYTFSDQPEKGSKKIIIDDNAAGRVKVTVKEKDSPLRKMRDQFLGASTSDDQQSNKASDQEIKKEYSSLFIANPTSEQSFWNQPEIGVMVQSDPELFEGHKIVLFMDGSQVLNPQESNKFSLNNVPRGEHTLKAAIIDENGRSIKQSASVTFFVHRTTLKEANNKAYGLMRLFRT